MTAAERAGGVFAQAEQRLLRVDPLLPAPRPTRRAWR